MTSQERQLCGIAAHEQLLKERDELRVVLSDLLQERNWEHRIGALQQAERELRHASLGLVGRWVGDVQRVLGLLSEALRGLPAYSAPALAPAPQEACCHVYVGDLGEMHQPNCTRRRQSFHQTMEAFAGRPLPVRHARFDEAQEEFRQAQRARAEAEAGAEAEAPPATDSTHE